MSVPDIGTHCSFRLVLLAQMLLLLRACMHVVYYYLDVAGAQWLTARCDLTRDRQSAEPQHLQPQQRRSLFSYRTAPCQRCGR